MVARSEDVTNIGHPYANTPNTFSYKNLNVPYSAVSETNWFSDSNLEFKSGDRILVDCQDIQGWAAVKADGKSIRGGDNPLQKIEINGPDDFPVQTSTELIIPKGFLYINNGFWETAKTIVSQGGKLSGIGTLDNSDPEITYTGTGNMFTADGASIVIENMVVACASGQCIKKIGGTPGTFGLVQLVNFTIAGCVTGIEVTDNTPIIIRLGAILDIAGAYGVKISGSNTIVNSIKECGFTGLQAGSIAIDLSSSTALEYEFVDIICPTLFGNDSDAIAISGLPNSGNVIVGNMGTIKDCNFSGLTTPIVGITQGDIRWGVQDSPPIRNSTTKGILHYADSALVTVMPGADTPTPINAIWSDGNIEERICFRDKLTFDNTTNTLTSVGGAVDAAGGSAFSHALSNSESVMLVENAGLPAELAEDTTYFVGDVTSTTFRLYEEVGLSTLVTFTDDGTEQNYYDHFVGDSSSGWFVYIAERDISIAPNGWITIQKNTGGDAATRVVVMKTDINFVISRQSNGSTISAKNGVPQSSVISDILDLKQGEGLIFYIENQTGAVDNVSPAARLTVRVA